MFNKLVLIIYKIIARFADMNRYINCVFVTTVYSDVHYHMYHVILLSISTGK